MAIEYNKLESSVPKLFGDLTNLEILDLLNNKISEIISTSMRKLLYLKELKFSFNKLEDEIHRRGSFLNFTR